MQGEDFVARIQDVFETVTDLSAKEVRPKALGAGDQEIDLALAAGDNLFVFEAKSSGEVRNVDSAIARLIQARPLVRDATLVVVVPYMNEKGQQMCRDAKISWMDLSGNAYLVAPGLRVIVRGLPNRFVRRGRPKNAFAPKSARVSRLLLLHPDQAFTQRAIAQQTGLGEGFVSRVVRGLESDELVVRSPDGAVKPRDPRLLLEAWREQYDFDKHRIHRVHIIARSGEAATRAIAHALDAAKVRYAATGLSAAWLLAPVAAFRTATFYVDTFKPELVAGLGVRPVSTGENVWFVEPNDTGVFDGVEDHGEIRCVSELQVYLDLKGHGERSKEAADALRAHLFQGTR